MRKEANGSAIEKSQTKINLCYVHISDDVCEKIYHWSFSPLTVSSICNLECKGGFTFKLDNMFQFFSLYEQRDLIPQLLQITLTINYTKVRNDEKNSS